MSRFLKSLLWTSCSLIGLFLASVSLLPTVLSTSWGSNKAIEWFNSQNHGILSVEHVKLSWFGQQTIENLVYENENGEKTIDVERFNTKTSLLYLALGGRSFGKTEIQKPYLVIEQDEKEKTKEKKEKKKKSISSEARRWPRFKDKLAVSEGTMIFKSHQISPITVSEIHLLKNEKVNIYHISAQTKQGGTEGKIDAEISSGQTLQAKGGMKNFPIAILDQLDQSSYFTDAIGQTIDLDFSLTRDLDGTTSISSDIKSQNVNGSLKGETKEKNLYLDPASHLTYTITPKLFKSLLPESQKEEWTLASNATATFDITHGTLPLSIKKPDIHDMILQAKGSIERAEISHKTLGSYSLNNFKMELTAQNNLEISYQGDIHGKEPSVVSGNLSMTPDGSILFKSNNKGFPVSLVSLFSPSAEKNIGMVFGRFFDLDAEGTYQNGKLDAQFTLAAPNLRVEGSLNGSPENLNIDISGNKTMTGKSAEYFGTALDFTAEGLANLSKEEMSIPLLNAKLTTPYYEVDVKGSIGEQTKTLDLNELKLVATGTVINLPYSKEFSHIALKNSGIFINMDGPANRIYGQAFVNTQVNSDQGVVDSKALETRFDITDYLHDGTLDFKKANISFNSKLDNLPAALLNPFVPGEIDLAELFGKTATIKAKGNYTPDQNPRFTLDLNARGEGLDADLAFAIDESLKVTQTRPSYINWELTPERYKALIATLSPDHQPIFLLTKPATLDLSIKELTFPTTFPNDMSHFLCQTGFVGDLNIGTLTFRSQGTQEYLVVKNTAGSIKGENFSREIELHLKGGILAQNVPQSEQSSFQFDGAMFNFWTPEGKFNRAGLAIDGELSLDLLPVRQATEIYPMDHETRQLVQAVLGELVNARIYGRISQLSGPLTIDVKSSNFKAKLPIMLHPNAIYLRDVVDAEITITPQVNQTLLTDINPLLITGAYSDHPIKVFIDPQGFMLPIRPYRLEGVQIGKAIIDIGKIRVRNGGHIQKLMNFLKATDITPEGEMTAWFTPIYMSLSNGAASYNRFDMLLANEFHIALWGSTNLVNNQVRMTLGIAPSTLKKRFKISGISKNELFQVKMRGTTNKLDLDWSAASTRIGVLVAKTAGGHIGMIIGGILEQIVTALGEEPSPPPTTVPFPWKR